tara:strand:+ start:3872 stop:4582 length:711 start_codon:yes stop_codon:yes gene_type:complete
MKDFVFPKVLLAAPQHDSKKYSWKEWLYTVKNLTYPNYEVFLAENSEDDSFAKEIEKEGITVKRVKNDKGVMYRLADAHNACRTYALKNDFDYLFHLETDVIPPLDVIERLLNHGKLIVSGCYDIWHGKIRKAMVQLDDDFDRSIRAYRTVTFADEQEPLLFNGHLRRVYHAGIGCILISKKVLEKVTFRYIEQQGMSADTWFANDCYKYDIPIYLDTTIQCEHWNFNWLAHKTEI